MPKREGKKVYGRRFIYSIMDELGVVQDSLQEYVLLTIDGFLQSAPEVLSIFPADKHKQLALEKKMVDDASNFRSAFVDAG